MEECVEIVDCRMSSSCCQIQIPGLHLTISRHSTAATAWLLSVQAFNRRLHSTTYEALADLLGSNYHSETINYKVILSSNLETLPGKLYDSKMLQIMFALMIRSWQCWGWNISIVLNYPALRWLTDLWSSRTWPATDQTTLSSSRTFHNWEKQGVKSG